MKRKREDPEAEESSGKPFAVDIELHQEIPLPLEWQQCLDIQSGQIHFYNIKTHKRTSRDPRRSPEQPSSPADEPLSLDLQLNLNSQSIRKDRFVTSDSGTTLLQSPPWLALEKTQQEMVARVCVRCHLLVMVLKCSPACPNCKFMQPMDLQSPPTLFRAFHARKNQSQSLRSFTNLIHNKV